MSSLTEIGSTSSGKEATKQDSSIVRILASNCCTSEPFKDTQEEKWLHLRCWANSSYLTIGKVFVLHRGCSFNLTSILNAGVIAGGREGREARHTVFFTPIGPTVYWRRRVLRFYETRNISLQNRMEALSKRCLLDSSRESTRERHSVLANEIACTRYRQHGANWLNRASHHTTRRNDSLPAIFKTETSSTCCSQKYLAWASAATAAAGCFESAAAGNCWQGTVWGTKPNQCGERRNLVSSRSPSPWSTTRRHLQRRGADDRDAKFGLQAARWMSHHVYPERFEARRYIQCGQRST